MKNLLCFICLAFVSTSTAIAQPPDLTGREAEDAFFIPERDSQTAHESSYQRDETPQQLVHRNAALRAAQRRERMAINAYFGYSPSRPPASTAPFMGSPIVPPMALRVYAPYPGMVFPRYYSR